MQVKYQSPFSLKYPALMLDYRFRALIRFKKETLTGRGMLPRGVMATATLPGGWDSISPARPANSDCEDTLIPASEALKRAIERGRDREHLGALYSGPRFAGD
jgi:hypothetical protein